MGSSKSKFSALTEGILEEYTILTYLSKAEILYIYKIFGQIDQTGALHSLNSRFPCHYVQEVFTQLKYNPFRDRIFQVFSSEEDGKMSFEDILDLCSAMSEKCPASVKAAWAFRILDFDGDGFVGEDDLAQVIQRLTQRAGYRTEEERAGYIREDEQNHIIKILIDEMSIECSGKVSIQEFIHAVGKMSEFPHSFCFRF
uniref:EF-hand domain-containing protein n=1 Tax=Dendroctonus ponderosae TaxID=77166 RepID=A0AAR5Q6V7_DENPD